ncbi:MAG: L,D-transpeptidase [Simkaniaceae bacterium]|nr:L,D-transpeptidase [Simkaniaceae bacterium]
MNFPKIFIISTLVIFSGITLAAIAKKGKKQEAIAPAPVAKAAIPTPKPIPKPIVVEAPKPEKKPVCHLKLIKDDSIEMVDRINDFFKIGRNKLPIVETVTYTSRVPWLKGRPAWIADYASHFKTSRHFIARSLNKKVDYFTQKVAPGDKFNVFRSDIDFSFYLLADLARLKMWFYYVDNATGDKELLKVYNIGVGTLDSSMPSGSLTPTGRFSLGDKIATYKPGVKSYFQNERIEMITVFGTRWIPFASDEGDEFDYGTGFGIHGAPCYVDEETGDVREHEGFIGVHNSDGCVRMSKNDMEELYAIVVTRPTILEITQDSAPLREAQ